MPGGSTFYCVEFTVNKLYISVRCRTRPLLSVTGDYRDSNWVTPRIAEDAANYINQLGARIRALDKSGDRLENCAVSLCVIFERICHSACAL